MTSGVVAMYRDAKGWGGIDSADVPGRVWFHISDFRNCRPEDVFVGMPVQFTWEAARQDSWDYRAVDVWADA